MNFSKSRAVNRSRVVGVFRIVADLRSNQMEFLSENNLRLRFSSRLNRCCLVQMHWCSKAFLMPLQNKRGNHDCSIVNIRREIRTWARLEVWTWVSWDKIWFLEWMILIECVVVVHVIVVVVVDVCSTLELRLLELLLLLLFPFQSFEVCLPWEIILSDSWCHLA